MAERLVPCTCPACKGSLVTRYTRRKHSKLYTDIEAAKKEKEEVRVEESRCLLAHAQPASIDEDISHFDGHDETGVPMMPISPNSPEFSPDSSSDVEDGNTVKNYMRL